MPFFLSRRIFQGLGILSILLSPEEIPAELMLLFPSTSPRDCRSRYCLLGVLAEAEMADSKLRETGELESAKKQTKLRRRL
jgi:hypothetical protein